MSETDNKSASDEPSACAPQEKSANGLETSTSLPASTLVFPANPAMSMQPFRAVLVNITGSDGTVRQAIQLKEVTAANGSSTNAQFATNSQTSEFQPSTVDDNVLSSPSSSSSQVEVSAESNRSKDVVSEPCTEVLSDCDPPAAKCIKLERQTLPSSYTAKTERAKQYNMFIRQLVDAKLDKKIPISLQPRDQIQEIIDIASSEFPDFTDCTRKRIRTYLKACRNSKPKSESSQLFNTSTALCDQRVPGTASSNLLASPSVSLCVANTTGASITFTEDNYASIRQLIQGYKQSATFLAKAAAELEQLLPPSSLSPLL